MKYPKEKPENAMTQAEVMEYFKVGRVTLWKWRKSGKIKPHYKIGRREYFLLSDLMVGVNHES